MFRSTARSIAMLSALVLSAVSLSLYAAVFDARLDWDDVRIVSIPVDGLVTAVDAEPGQYVASGDSLIRFSQASPRFALRKSQAAVSATAPALKEALREKNDAEVLYEQTVLSDVELQAAQIKYQQVKAKHDAAEADLDRAKWALGWTRITSSYAAVVIASSVLPGQMVAGDVRSEALMTLASSTSMRAVATVALDRLQGIKVGDSMRVTVGTDSYRGEVVRIQHLIEKNAVDRVRLMVRYETSSHHHRGMKAKIESSE